MYAMECKLRKWKTEDARELAAMINNKNIQNNLRDGLPFPYSENDAKTFIRELLTADASNTFVFAVTYKEKIAGSIGVYRKDNIHFRTGELGYYIAEPYWGKGLGTSAVRQICEYIFNKTDIIRIFAEPFAYNAASCSILEKNGFVYEGTLRRNAVKNGRILDMKMYALIKPGF